MPQAKHCRCGERGSGRGSGRGHCISRSGGIGGRNKFSESIGLKLIIQLSQGHVQQ